MRLTWGTTLHFLGAQPFNSVHFLEADCLPLLSLSIKLVCVCGSTSSMCELAIHKVIIHESHEDFLISIDRLVVVPVVVLHGIAVRDLCRFSREILGSERIHEYEAVKRSISIVVIGRHCCRYVA
jgi:hypothetical protein